MLRRFSVDFAIFSMLLDGLLVMFALRLAETIRPALTNMIPAILEITDPVSIPGFFYLAAAAIWVVVCLLFSVYDGRKNFKIADELTSLFLATVMASIAQAGLLYLTYRDLSRALFLVFILFAFILTFLFRIIYRLIFRSRVLSSVQQRRILVIGAGPVGRQVAEHVTEYEGLGLSLVGFLDDDKNKRSTCNDILGDLNEARTVIAREKVDDVVLALPRYAFNRTSVLVSELHDLPVKVWVVPDYFALALNRASMEELAGIPMIDLRAPALSDYQRMVKRIFDVVVTCAAMPLALPVMLITAVAIRIESPGPVFFKQKRVGENGRIFEMYKFRSMVENAEEMRHVIEKVDENGKITQDKSLPDPRITRVGAFIRRTSIDELPNLLNILKGEMSWVGPRPEMPHLVEQYEPWQRRRFAVPQGLTGWWQVNGRSDKPMHMHTEEDLYYVQNYSLWLDILILIKTVGTVLRRKGAY